MSTSSSFYASQSSALVCATHRVCNIWTCRGQRSTSPVTRWTSERRETCGSSAFEPWWSTVNSCCTLPPAALSWQLSTSLAVHISSCQRFVFTITHIQILNYACPTETGAKVGPWNCCNTQTLQSLIMPGMIWNYLTDASTETQFVLSILKSLTVKKKWVEYQYHYYDNTSILKQFICSHIHLCCWIYDHCMYIKWARRMQKFAVCS